MQVIFAVADLQRSLSFYEQAFGWPRNDRIDYDDYVELEPRDGGTLGLFEREGYAGLVGAEPVEIEDGAVAPAYAYFRVEDLDAAISGLESVGARRLSAPALRSWGETAAWFADPDGNVVAVAGPSAG